MKLKSNIAISESGFVFNPATGDSFSTNPVGLRIMELLKDNKSYQEILENIIAEFDVDRPRLEQDIDDYFSLLRQLHLTQNE